MIDRTKVVTTASDLDKQSAGYSADAERKAAAKVEESRAARRALTSKLKKGMTTETFRLKTTTADEDEGPFRPEPRRTMTAPWNRNR